MRDDLQLLLCRSKRNRAVRAQHENIRHSTCFSDQVMFVGSYGIRWKWAQKTVNLPSQSNVSRQLGT